MNNLPSAMVLSDEVAHALQKGLPVVALESAVITHGLPRPENLQLAQALEKEIRDQGATPATVGLLDGKVHVGLLPEELNRLANEDGGRKISRRDFGLALVRKEIGGTTVAGTMIAAHLAGIQVFATGGIGGVHRNTTFDISADLPELGRTPMVVVCAGAKSILDLPNTLEVLETQGVPVIGYGADEFPAFYSRESGLPVNVRVDCPDDVAEIANAQWALGLQNGLLVVQPPPAEAALPAAQINLVIEKALEEAEQKKIHGAAVTPFLLSRVSELSGGASLQTNLALLRNNARLAAKIALAFSAKKSSK
jgi:pseudouridine-5'-phosphate glycosidase